MVRGGRPIRGGGKERRNNVIAEAITVRKSGMVVVITVEISPAEEAKKAP